MSKKSLQDPIIGRVKGAEETTYEFKFITPTQENTNIGEFIYYFKNISKKINEGFKNTVEKVLCQVKRYEQHQSTGGSRRLQLMEMGGM